MTDYLKFTSRSSRETVPVLDDSQAIYVLAEITPGSVISETRMPLNFAVVLDRSGSMAGEKLNTMKQAVAQIIDQLDEEDIISIITFETRTELLAEAQPLVDKKALKRQIEKIRDGGGTNIGPALSMALKLVSKNAGATRLNRIILLTDGEATDREADSFKIADEAGSLGIAIIGLGFGKDWKEEYLFEVADRSIQANPGSRIGMADYIPAPEDISKIFQEVFQSMQVVARDLVLTIRLVQGLEVRRIWQVTPLIRQMDANIIQDRSIQIPISHLERSGAAFLVEISLPPRPTGVVRIAQADITFRTTEHGLQRQSADLILKYSPNPEDCQDYDERVMKVVEKVQAFRLQTQALDDAQVGDIGSATRKLRQAVTILLSHGETSLAEQMEQEAERLEQSGQVSNEGRKTIMLSSRKTVRLTE